MVDLDLPTLSWNILCMQQTRQAMVGKEAKYLVMKYLVKTNGPNWVQLTLITLSLQNPSLTLNMVQAVLKTQYHLKVSIFHLT